MRRTLTLVLIASLAAIAIPSISQDSKEKPFTPRLPRHYAAIVTPSQRKQIYALQERYAREAAELKSKLAELQLQLDQLTSQRDAEIEAVLSPLQLKQLTAAREAAAAKRKKSQ